MPRISCTQFLVHMLTHIQILEQIRLPTTKDNRRVLSGGLWERDCLCNPWWLTNWLMNSILSLSSFARRALYCGHIQDTQTNTHNHLCLHMCAHKCALYLLTFITSIYPHLSYPWACYAVTTPHHVHTLLAHSKAKATIHSLSFHSHLQSQTEKEPAEDRHWG